MRTLLIYNPTIKLPVLKSYIHKKFPDITILRETCSVEESIIAIKELNPKLLIINIELSTEVILRFFSQLKEINFSIIFLNGKTEAEFESSNSNNIINLSKETIKNTIQNYGFTKETIDQELLKPNSDSISFKNDLIAISSVNEIEYVHLNDIIRCQAEGKYTACYLDCEPKKILSSKNLGEFERTFESKGFFRTHHSHIINTKYLKRFSKKDNIITLTNGDSIPLSQRKKDYFLSFLETCMV
jgi:two-component system, LytTR family, response regulator